MKVLSPPGKGSADGLRVLLKLPTPCVLGGRCEHFDECASRTEPKSCLTFVQYVSSGQPQTRPIDCLPSRAIYALVALEDSGDLRYAITRARSIDEEERAARLAAYLQKNADAVMQLDAYWQTERAPA